MIFSATIAVQAQEWRDSLRNARSSYKENEYEKAFFQYTAAQKLASSSVDLSAETAQTLYKLGKYELAEKMYKRGLLSLSDVNRKSEIYRQIGNTQYRQSKYAEAITSYKASLKINPDDAVARYNLAMSVKKLNTARNKDNSPKESGAEAGTEQTGKTTEGVEESTMMNAANADRNQGNNPLDRQEAEQLKTEISRKEEEAKGKMRKQYGGKTPANQKNQKDW